MVSGAPLAVARSLNDGGLRGRKNMASSALAPTMMASSTTVLSATGPAWTDMQSGHAAQAKPANDAIATSICSRGEGNAQIGYGRGPSQVNNQRITNLKTRWATC